MPFKVTEALFVADEGSKQHNCIIYDLESGAALLRLKDGHTVKRGMARFQKDYIIGGLSNEPILKVWMLNKGEPESLRMPCMGIPTSLAVSDCGTYCAVGVNEVIYLWHIVTGNLVMRLKQHSQAVTVLRLSSDGSRIISGGKDGMALVWQFDYSKSEREADSVKPIYTWNIGGLEVTDICIAGLGIQSRVAVSSRDMSCKIYELDSGYLLCTIQTSFPITAVTMDCGENYLYMGSDVGDIYRMNLFSIDDSCVFFDNEEKKHTFKGHTSEITCLSLAILGKSLISGSKDKDCRVWDLESFACVKRIPCSGAVTNAFSSYTPSAFLSDKKPPPPQLSTFKLAFDPEGFDTYTVRLQEQKLSLSHLTAPDNFFDSRILNNCTETLKSGNEYTDKASSINMNIYSFSLAGYLDDTYEKKKEDEEHDKDDY